MIKKLVCSFCFIFTKLGSRLEELVLTGVQASDQYGIVLVHTVLNCGVQEPWGGRGRGPERRNEGGRGLERRNLRVLDCLECKGVGGRVLKALKAIRVELKRSFNLPN